MSLNNKQTEAVNCTEGPLLLLAGAGSGKTTVLIHRIAHILETQDVTPWGILAITFTNKAANELKTRLENMLGAQANDIWALTFHSACVRMLRRDADRLGFPKGFTIYDKADSEAVVKRIIKEMNLDPKVYVPKLVLSRCAFYKSQLISAEDFLQQEEKFGDIRRTRMAEVCCAYAKRLKDAGAMDFDDLIYYCVMLLKDNLDVLQHYQEQFKYILIDEYQDTNHLQYLFASMLAGKYRNICVVGDDDQSIYKFRGATIENILNFENQYPDAKVIRLEQNYRSTGNILAAANAVIANNTERKGKSLWTEQENGSLITLYSAYNEDDEASYIARTICNEHRPMRSFAVLYRSNAQSRSIEQALRSYNVPYKIFGGTRFFDRAEVKDMLAYLCVIANPTDETRLLRIVNTPARGIGQTSLDKALAIANESGLSLFEVMQRATVYGGISAAKRMEEFCQLVEELQEQASALPLDEFYDLVMERTGYVADLEKANTDENLARLENVYELKSSIMKSMEQNNGGDLYSFLDEVALYTDLDEMVDSDNYVSLMTMHSAKGLEFPVVFMAGTEEGIFPSKLSETPADLEEERRLCYVAITRAMEKLYITCALSRTLYGSYEAKLPSRFTDEIPDDLLDRQGRVRETRYKEGYPVREDDYYSTPYANSNSFAYGNNKFTFGKTKAPVSKPKVTLTPPKSEPLPQYSLGDKIVHKAFGNGIIQAMQTMGNDSLVTIYFDEIGEKKLMLRVASQHMKKAEN